MCDAEPSSVGRTFSLPSISAPAATYEELLNQDLTWAMSEGSLYFEGQGRVQQTLKRICHKLDELQIPYAVAGGMALFAQGFRRFTEDVDILVSREGLTRLHEALDGLGYLRPFENSKNLRDTELRVKIEFLVAGEFPGDGKPKPVAFPDPALVAVELQGIKYLSLPALIELKLASGMTSPDRSKDLVDVEQLVMILDLPESIGEQLNPYVQAKFKQLWTAMRFSPVRYLSVREYQRTATGLVPICDAGEQHAAAELELQAMLVAGVAIDAQAAANAQRVRLSTNDRVLARRFGMELESDFFNP